MYFCLSMIVHILLRFETISGPVRISQLSCIQTVFWHLRYSMIEFSPIRIYVGDNKKCYYSKWPTYIWVKLIFSYKVTHDMSSITLMIKIRVHVRNSFKIYGLGDWIPVPRVDGCVIVTTWIRLIVNNTFHIPWQFHWYISNEDFRAHGKFDSDWAILKRNNVGLGMERFWR